MNESLRPLARTQGLLTEQLDDELLIYDEERHVGSRLNRTAELVWRSSDGSRSVAELADALRSEGVEEADEDLVLVALDRLHESGLILSGFEARSSDETRLSRRRFIRRVGVVGTAAMALPVVQSVLAPAAAAAASGGGIRAAAGACSCPCYCGCGTCAGSCNFSSCGTCQCLSCDYQLGSCLACNSCAAKCASGCTGPCNCGSCNCSYTPASGTCQCGSDCGYCNSCGPSGKCGNGGWFCSSCSSHTTG